MGLAVFSRWKVFEIPCGSHRDPSHRWPSSTRPMPLLPTCQGCFLYRTFCFPCNFSRGGLSYHHISPGSKVQFYYRAVTFAFAILASGGRLRGTVGNMVPLLIAVEARTLDYQRFRAICFEMTISPCQTRRCTTFDTSSQCIPLFTAVLARGRLWALSLVVAAAEHQYKIQCSPQESSPPFLTTVVASP